MKRALPLMLVLIIWTVVARAAITTTTVDLKTRGVTQRVLYLVPDRPVANVILIPGADGRVNLDKNGHGNSELLEASPATRLRARLASLGYAVAVVDAPSDKQTSGMIAGYRQGREVVTDIATVIDDMRSRYNVPVWIVGDHDGATSALHLAINLPPKYQWGTISIAARTSGLNSALDLHLDQVRTPVLVISHVKDECAPIADQTKLVEDLNAAPAEHVVFSAGPIQSGACNFTYFGGYHLFEGLDAELTDAIASHISRYSPRPEPVALNHQGLWYAAPAESESGWGINFAHQGDVIFATWFTYDKLGKAWWLTMTAPKIAEGVFGGDLYKTTGAPFSAFVPPASATRVGTGTLTFTSTNAGTFAYVVDGVAQSKQIVPQVFGPLPTCAWGEQPDLTKATNFQDLWWSAPAESESGWGVNLTHQGNTIFATWFTYDANREPLWLSVTAAQTATNTFTGTLYLTNGPAFSAIPFNPAAVTRNPVGTATFSFSDGNNGTFAYDVDLGDGVNRAAQSKAITRQVFQSPGTTCEPNPPVPPS